MNIHSILARIGHISYLAASERRKRQIKNRGSKMSIDNLVNELWKGLRSTGRRIILAGLGIIATAVVVPLAGVGYVLFGNASVARAVNSNSIVQDDIEYYMQTDKSVYDLGEDV